MSSIASGPGLGSGFNVDLSVQQVGATDPRLSLNTDASAAASASAASVNVAASTQVSANTAATSADSASVVTSTQASAGSAPVDTDRVATIKKAIETGNYPLVPTKIGDAMIAAGMLLRINT